MTKVYYAAVDGHIEGRQRVRGELIGQLTDQQANYLLMAGHIVDHDPTVKLVEPAPEPDEPNPATLGRKTR